MSRLQGFQRKIDSDIENAWDSGARVVMAVAPTGAGKTVIAAEKARQHRGPGCIIAHRRELVSQISIAYAREGIAHDIIAQPNTIRQIRTSHLEEFGRQFIDPRAQWKIASVDTLVRRDPRDPWFASVTKFFGDEGHHFLRLNKWGAAYHMFTNPKLKGLLLTATPDRADGQGLGADADGIVNALVLGPELREVIDQGYLTDYEVRTTHPDDLELDGLTIGKDGDFIPDAMRKAMAKSNKIIGDVVATYLQYARGKLGVTFAASVDEARRLCDAFNKAGVPAAIVTADTDEIERRNILKRFKNRELLQLVNVDLFGEGYDLPAIECVSMARPTASFSLYAQQWGRALRLMVSPILRAAWDTFTVAQRKQFIHDSGKPFAYIFDHVGNVLRHKGPPDIPRPWTLARRERRTNISSGLIPQYACLGCSQTFARTELACPYCGEDIPEPSGAARSSPDLVDGDLFLLTPEILKKMRDAVKKIDGPALLPKSLTGHAAVGARKTHHARQVAQHELRDRINWWAGIYPGDSDRVNQRRFFHTFKIDLLSAFSLNTADADALRLKIEGVIHAYQNVG